MLILDFEFFKLMYVLEIISFFCKTVKKNNLQEWNQPSAFKSSSSGPTSVCI